MAADPTTSSRAEIWNCSLISMNEMLKYKESKKWNLNTT